MDDASRELRVRPAWWRARTLAGGLSSLAGAVLVVVGLGVWWSGVAATPPGTLAYRVEHLRACSTASRSDAVRLCLPPADEIGEHPVATSKMASQAVDPAVRSALLAWEQGGDGAAYSALLGLHEQARAEGAVASPDGLLVQEALAAEARSWSASELPRAEADLAWTQGVLGELGAWLWWGLLTGSSASLLPLGLILGLYGLASVWWASRPFLVRLREDRFEVGPPTGVRVFGLGALQQVQLEQGRLAITELDGDVYRTPVLHHRGRLSELLEATEQAIADAAPDGGPRLRLERSADAVRLEQSVGDWRLWVARAAMGGAVVLVAVTAVLLFRGFLHETRVAHDAELLPDRTALEVCGRGLRSPACRAVQPASLHDVPAPHVLERWRLHDLSLAYREQGRRPQVFMPVDSQWRAWLASLQRDPRATGHYIWADVEPVDDPVVQAAIASRAATEAGALSRIYKRVWSDASVEARWQALRTESVRFRQDGLAHFLASRSLAIGLLGVLALALWFIPMLYLRRSTVSVSVTARGVHWGRHTWAFADIADARIERRRIVLVLWSGPSFRSGRLTSPAVGQHVIDAIHARLLTADQLREESSNEHRARAALARAKGVGSP